jgi:hypothetical protein
MAGESPGGMSVVDDSLDQMVQAASIPSLASLFRQAKDQGVIVPVSNYGEGQSAAQSSNAPF